MATYTPNYNLKKPADADSYDIADANGNMDIIDGALGTLNNQLGDFEFITKTCLATSSVTISRTECIRGILVTIGGAEARMGMWLFYNASRGFLKQITSGDNAATAITVTTDGTTLTIANSASAAVTCHVLVLDK